VIEKKLEIAKIPINCYPDFAYPLSIALNFESGWNWFYCNFIQLYFDEKDLYNPIRFYYTDVNGSFWNVRNPLLNYQTIQRDTFLKFDKDINEFIIDSIDMDNYIMLFIDEYYIPDRWAYHTSHYHHAIFIYGYDKEKNTFYTSGYNKRFHYEHQEVSFNEIRDSYVNHVNQYWDDNNCIYLMQFDKKRMEFNFDIVCIIEQLEEYLYSRKSSLRYNTFFNNQKLHFGRNIYEHLKNYYYAIHANNSTWNFQKPVYLLAEHKKIMADRILYLEKNNILNNCDEHYSFFKTLSEDLSNNLIYLLKYGKNRKKEYIDNICLLLDAIVLKEEPLIVDIIDKLKEYNNRKNQN
jgi:hypothetical protein